MRRSRIVREQREKHHDGKPGDDAIKLIAKGIARLQQERKAQRVDARKRAKARERYLGLR
jgi:hypothetical protein